jgi:MFS superfamily sulfate permease-like transporter
MRGFDIVAIIIGIFFVIGIAVGILLVIALPLLQAMLLHRRNRRRYGNGSDRWKLPPNDDDRRPPRWPGG